MSYGAMKYTFTTTKKYGKTQYCTLSIFRLFNQKKYFEKLVRKSRVQPGSNLFICSTTTISSIIQYRRRVGSLLKLHVFLQDSSFKTLRRPFENIILFLPIGIYRTRGHVQTSASHTFFIARLSKYKKDRLLKFLFLASNTLFTNIYNY